MSDLPSIQAVASSNDNNTPLPLIVAKRWGFPLASIENDEGVFYAVQDWIAGLVGSQDVRKVWNDIKRKGSLAQLSDSIRQLPYIASNGKTYQIDFTTDKGLYLIAQNLRSTKARPALSVIKKFLAEAGAFVDEIRRDPDAILLSGAMTPDQAMEAAIRAYRAQGKDDRWIQARLEGKIKRHQFTAALQAAVAETLKRQHYAMATDDIYKGLWGRTAAYLKKELELPKNASLRDHQPTVALTYQRLAEEVAAQKLGKRTELSWHEARQIVQHVAALIGSQAKITSEFLEMDLATGYPLLPA
ncbi:MAG: hypothetical protein H7Y09_11990 [Chitinophagaceae bacterium]|nr:hypothetical protein [Anaerolineae bacterium]